MNNTKTTTTQAIMLNALKEAQAALEMCGGKKKLSKSGFIPVEALAYNIVTEAIKQATTPIPKKKSPASENEFRGKRIDNGKWVYGSLVIGSDGFYYIVTGSQNTWTWDEVHPETVGQSTGVLDMNGRLIYEGMPLRHYHRFEMPKDEDTKEMEVFESEDFGEVIFEGGSFMFHAKNEHGGSVTCSLESYGEFEEYTFEITEKL